MKLLVLLSLVLLLTLGTGQCQETQMTKGTENYKPSSVLPVQTVTTSEMKCSKSKTADLHDERFTKMPTIPYDSSMGTETPQAGTVVNASEGTKRNTSRTTSIVLEPSITRLLSQADRSEDHWTDRTQVFPSETLFNAVHSTSSSTRSPSFSFHKSNSLESDFQLNSEIESNLASFTAESFSSEGTASSYHSHHFSRFSHHSISTLSLDLISLVTAIMSTQPLLSTAQTPISHADVTMTTTQISDSIMAASVSDDTTVTDDVTSEDVHNTSGFQMSTVLPRLMSAATEIDNGLPSGGVWENNTLVGVTLGEKSTHLTEGSIAGIVLGCIAAVVAFSLLMLCFCCKQKKLVNLSPKKKKKKKTSHYTGLFDDGITLSYINCQFEPTKDPIDEMTSLDNDAYLNSLEQYMVNQTWSSNTSNTPNTSL